MIITTGSKVKDGIDNLYIIDEQLGQGGFGNVYKAHNEKDETIVAVKTLQNDFKDKNAFLSFQKEANQSKLINAEHVVKYLFIHDGQQFDDLPPYIIMEYTNDGTLRDRINSKKGNFFDNNTLKDLFLQLSHGMKSINNVLVHRDIKPENILVFNKELKITDFGLSKIANESTKSLSFKNAGTLQYIAPEAWENDKNTIQMDIYSMGIVFYELATLSYPYNIPAKTDYENYKNMHLFDTVINPSSKNPNLPPNIVSMIIKMLEKPTQSRYKNWDEIIAVLNADPLPEDEISSFVNQAIAKRNEKDLEQQKQQSERRKADTERNDYIKFVFSQFHNTITEPINRFVEVFNSQYSGGRELSVKEMSPVGKSISFTTTVKTTSGQNIMISGEILFKENFSRQVHSIFGNTITQNYVPQCNNKGIILWCQVKDNAGYGFNILLLKNEESMYGDWFVLENESNAFTQGNRLSPFGFSLSELPKEIELINATHIYSSKLFPFEKKKLIQFIVDRA